MSKKYNSLTLNENCKGCRSSLKSCLLIITNIECPCTTCLIKMICKDRCDNRRYIYLDIPTEERYKLRMMRKRILRSEQRQKSSKKISRHLDFKYTEAEYDLF